MKAIFTINEKEFDADRYRRINLAIHDTFTGKCVVEDYLNDRNFVNNPPQFDAATFEKLINNHVNRLNGEHGRYMEEVIYFLNDVDTKASAFINDIAHLNGRCK